MASWVFNCHALSFFLPSNPITKQQPPNHNRTSTFPPNRSNPSPLPRTTLVRVKNSSSATAAEQMKEEESMMSIDNLNRFFDLNKGNWSGSFHQFDGHGNLMQKVSTKLAVSTYGEDELISLIQTLQIGFFPDERAFSLRYQTAGMLETVLRQGVLGEDDTGEESPKNLKLPSRQPAIVCENCLYSQEKDRRVRAFHIMDPKGILEMLLIFLEDRDGRVLFPPFLENVGDNKDRILPFLGKWKGHSITKRSGVYGATIAEADSVALLKMDDKGQLIQDINSTSNTSDGQEVTTNVHWTGTMSGNLVTFEGAYQFTFLPGGMYMGCPCDIAKSVAEFKSFHLEFGWVETPCKRQRLVRTYDVEGLAVSSTYFSEIKL
ncbi:DUF3598 domain-containing protein [Citrus sinensis]|uniref:DUF3598 domain-containing protein n=1 Tax=Citrus sinensis TaxID=2711 RepID=A0ACB8K728_CITSI|nr:DUF3598 domain-containing protein [Citrus sinensis]